MVCLIIQYVEKQGCQFEVVQRRLSGDANSNNCWVLVNFENTLNLIYNFGWQGPWCCTECIDILFQLIHVGWTNNCTGHEGAVTHKPKCELDRAKAMLLGKLNVFFSCHLQYEIWYSIDQTEQYSWSYINWNNKENMEARLRIMEKRQHYKLLLQNCLLLQ